MCTHCRGVPRRVPPRHRALTLAVTHSSLSFPLSLSLSLSLALSRPHASRHSLKPLFPSLSFSLTLSRSLSRPRSVYHHATRGGPGNKRLLSRCLGCTVSHPVELPRQPQVHCVAAVALQGLVHGQQVPPALAARAPLVEGAHGGQASEHITRWRLGAAAPPSPRSAPWLAARAAWGTWCARAPSAPATLRRRH